MDRINGRLDYLAARAAARLPLFAEGVPLPPPPDRRGAGPRGPCKRTRPEPEPIPPDLADLRLLSSGQVAELLGVSKRTVWRMVKHGTFPRPTGWNKKLVRWSAADVKQYLARVAQRHLPDEE